jgi:type II secretory pathway pseudopilin PulG
MRKRGGGFTIVELMVTIVVMVVLTTLVATRLRFTQASGRDKERAIDISTIATGLEVYYNNGNVTTYTPKGYYPGAVELNTAAALTPPFKEFLEGVSASSLTAPDRAIDTSFGVDPNYATSPAGTNTDGSYSDAQVRPLLVNFPYLYQPLKRNNTFCAGYIDCVKFNLYYLEETSNTVIKIGSKNQ